MIQKEMIKYNLMDFELHIYLIDLLQRIDINLFIS